MEHFFRDCLLKGLQFYIKENNQHHILTFMLVNRTASPWRETTKCPKFKDCKFLISVYFWASLDHLFLVIEAEIGKLGLRIYITWCTCLCQIELFFKYQPWTHQQSTTTKYQWWTHHNTSTLPLNNGGIFANSICCVDIVQSIYRIDM